MRRGLKFDHGLNCQRFVSRFTGFPDEEGTEKRCSPLLRVQKSRDKEMPR